MVSLISNDIPNDDCSNIDCKQALEILDQINWQTDPCSAELTSHLETCPACAAAAKVEDALRSVIAPPELPSLSVDFEKNLMAQLGIKPLPVVIPRPYLNPVSRWGWAAAIMVISTLLFNQIIYLFEVVHSVGLLVYAKAAALFAGKTALAFSSYLGYVPKSIGHGDTLAMNIAFGIIVIAGAISAVRWAADRN
ncbi:MAG: hypothetical protein HN757_10900 [Calditrichaeota bacterium]|nr:hypothetical protein [Calditrichota bacterium]